MADWDALFCKCWGHVWKTKEDPWHRDAEFVKQVCTRCGEIRVIERTAMKERGPRG